MKDDLVREAGDALREALEAKNPNERLALFSRAMRLHHEAVEDDHRPHLKRTPLIVRREA